MPRFAKRAKRAGGRGIIEQNTQKLFCCGKKHGVNNFPYKKFQDPHTVFKQKTRYKNEETIFKKYFLLKIYLSHQFNFIFQQFGHIHSKLSLGPFSRQKSRNLSVLWFI